MNNLLEPYIEINRSFMVQLEQRVDRFKVNKMPIDAKCVDRPLPYLLNLFATFIRQVDFGKSVPKTVFMITNKSHDNCIKLMEYPVL